MDGLREGLRVRLLKKCPENEVGMLIYCIAAFMQITEFTLQQDIFMQPSISFLKSPAFVFKMSKSLVVSLAKLKQEKATPTQGQLDSSQDLKHLPFLQMNGPCCHFPLPFFTVW